MPTPERPIVLHGSSLSGHVHRVRLFLSLLNLPVDEVAVDLANGAHKAPGFLALSPFGQVPAIVDGDVVLADSNAILVYLAGRYDESGRWLPRDPVGAARVQAWLSVAAGQLAHGPAAARIVRLFDGKLDHQRAATIAAGLFAVMERALESRPCLVGDTPTIADIALYTYTAHAPEGGLPLDSYPHIRSWLHRIEALPGFVGMQRSPVAAAS